MFFETRVKRCNDLALSSTITFCSDKHWKLPIYPTSDSKRDIATTSILDLKVCQSSYFAASYQLSMSLKGSHLLTRRPSSVNPLDQKVGLKKKKRHRQRKLKY